MGGHSEYRVSKREIKAGKREWEWYALPVNGGDPVPMGAGAALRAAGLSTAVFVVFGERLLFSAGADADRRNVWQIRYDPATMRVAGTPLQLTFGTEREVPWDVNPAGTVALASNRTSSDVYLLPLDHATGQVSGALRRLTSDGATRSVSFTGGEPGKVYLNRSSRFPLLATWAFDPRTSQQRLLHPESGEAALVRVSPDGTRVAFSRSEAGSFFVGMAATDVPLEKAKPVCPRCGMRFAFSPDGQHLVVATQDEAAKGNSISLVEVATGRTTEWLPGETGELLEITSFLGRDHVVITTGRKRYVLPWRLTPVPRSEWGELPADSGKWSFSRWAPFAYSFEGDGLVFRRYDLKQKRFDDPRPVLFPSGSAVRIQADDSWAVQGPGIVFTHRESATSAWLMKLPPE